MHCPTLCYLTDCSPPGSFVHGIFQARILEWVAISFSGKDYMCIYIYGISSEGMMLKLKLQYFGHLM